jgi:hypothetical protein
MAHLVEPREITEVTGRKPAIDVAEVQAALDRVANEVREKGPQDGRVKRKEVGA